MRIAVTGARGLLGRAVVRIFFERGWEVVALTRENADLRELDEVLRVVKRASPSVLVNCAGYTDVDGAESTPEAAYAVNERGARHVAEAAAEAGAYLVHISTDYVFDGRSREPYSPDAQAAPLNVYGQSKLAGERAVAGAGARWAVVRTSWLYGAGGRDFLDTILERAEAGEPLRVVEDQWGRPTWTVSLAHQLEAVVEHQPEGVLHCADDGVTTWYELAREALRLTGCTVEVEAVRSDAFPHSVARPRYSVLDLRESAARLGITPPRWQDSLRRYLGTVGLLRKDTREVVTPAQ